MDIVRLSSDYVPIIAPAVDIPGDARGSYVLLIALAYDRAFRAGSLPERCYPAGFYAYTGSALGGIRGRVGHHLKRDKKLHWHIDYLLEWADVVGVGIRESALREECTIARRLAARFDSVAGFGCSDCSCRSHLFYCDDEDNMKSGIESAGVTMLAPEGRKY